MQLRILLWSIVCIMLLSCGRPLEPPFEGVGFEVCDDKMMGARSDSVDVLCNWRAPTTGGPVDEYDLILSTGQEFISLREKLRVRIPKGVPVRGKVRGRNDEGAGPYTPWGSWWPARGDTAEIDNPYQ